LRVRRKSFRDETEEKAGRKIGRRKHTEETENRRGEKEGSDDEEVIREERSSRRVETSHEVLQGGWKQ
jgi:hypothetical protein